MTDDEIFRLERQYPDIRSIEGGTPGLKYIYDDDRRGVVIAGMIGRAFLTPAQAYTLAGELKDVLEWIGIEPKAQRMAAGQEENKG